MLLVNNALLIQEMQEMKVQSLVQEYPWRRSWQPTPVFMPEEFHGQRSWEGYIAQSRTQLKQLSMYTHTHTHTHTRTHTETNWSNRVYLFYPHKEVFLGPCLKSVLKNPITSIILIM